MGAPLFRCRGCHWPLAAGWGKPGVSCSGGDDDGVGPGADEAASVDALFAQQQRSDGAGGGVEVDIADGADAVAGGGQDLLADEGVCLVVQVRSRSQPEQPSECGATEKPRKLRIAQP